MEIDRLRARVNWLDRWRHFAAVAVTLIAVPEMFGWLAQNLGDEWSPIHIGALVVIAGSVLWFAVEIVLAWTAAVWEARHDAMCNARYLPVAILIRRRA